MIEIQKILKDAPFPVIDFKFQNQGRGTAMVSEFSLCIESMEVDISPVLRASFTIPHSENTPNERHALLRAPSQNEVRGPLQVSLRNVGWGSAEKISIEVDSPLGQLFPNSCRKEIKRISSDETVQSVFVFSPCELNLEKFASLLSASRPLQSSAVEVTNRRPSDAKNSGQLPIDAPELHLTYHDVKNRQHSVTTVARRKSLPGDLGGALALSQECFIWDGRNSDILCCMSEPTAIYYVSLDPDEKIERRRYQVSHKIPSGDVEHFSIMLGSDKSCTATVWLEFRINADQTLRSERFNVNILNPRDEQYHHGYYNGDELLSKVQSLGESPNEKDLLRRYGYDWVLMDLMRNPFPFMSRDVRQMYDRRWGG